MKHSHEAMTTSSTCAFDTSTPDPSTDAWYACALRCDCSRPAKQTRSHKSWAKAPPRGYKCISTHRAISWRLRLEGRRCGGTDSMSGVGLSGLSASRARAEEQPTALFAVIPRKALRPACNSLPVITAHLVRNNEPCLNAGCRTQLDQEMATCYGHYLPV
jgi:hypothetical protein